MKRTNDRKRYYEKAYKNMLITGKLTGSILDPTGVLKGNLGLPGIYFWNVLDLQNNNIICAYIGETEDLELRTWEHLKRWLFNDQTLFYLGILPQEIGSRYILILNVEIDPAGIAYSDKSKRLAAERQFIAKYKPYTQYTEDLNKKINANLLDSCTWHCYRREAFLDAVAKAG